MILVDANVLMYAAGAPHANKAASVAFLERVALGELVAAIDVEVLQEILHRYRAIRRWEDGSRLFILARRVFSRVLTVTPETLDGAHRLMQRHVQLQARDALHAAVYQQACCDSFCSFDRDFDALPGIRRVEPQALLA